MLAYTDWRWYADAAAKGMIGAVTVFAVVAGATYVMGGSRKREESNTGVNPFADNTFKASSRPAARPGRPEAAPSLMN